MTKLHVDSVSKSYRNKVILSDIYLSCHTGEIVALIGRNGSGKSTLLKIIFGCEKAGTKFVRAGDRIVRSIADGRNRVNYLPQENFLPNGIRIRKLIEFFLPRGKREPLLKNEFIRPLLGKKNHELSGGERRIVEIMLLIHSKAEFILLDEPFNGLGPKIRDYIVALLGEYRSEKGFIITDHDYNNVMNLADRFVFLQNGFLREVNNKRQLIELGYLSERHV